MKVTAGSTEDYRTSGKHSPRCYSIRTVNRRILSPIVQIFATVLLILAGCDKEESIASYAAPKEPQLLKWSLPGNWQKAPYNHKLQYAGFVVGEEEQAVKITVSYLFPNANGARDLLLNVNRWRRQLGLPAVPASELGTLVTATHQPGLTMQVVDIPGTSGQRMRATIVPRQDRIWFFKMTGSTGQIDAQKQTFDAFVQSVKYPAPEGEALVAAADAPGDLPATLPTAPPIPAPSATAELNYSLPNGWSRQPNANAMRVATLGTGGDKPAQLIVTRLSANFGGMMMNLNRWRGEVGLPPSEAGAEMKETPIVIGATPGSVVDLAGPGKDGKAPMRSLIARCTQGDSVWFFKLLGPAETIAQQQTAFQAFLLSVRLPGEPAK